MEEGGVVRMEDMWYGWRMCGMGGGRVVQVEDVWWYRWRMCGTDGGCVVRMEDV